MLLQLAFAITLTAFNLRSVFAVPTNSIGSLASPDIVEKSQTAISSINLASPKSQSATLPAFQPGILLLPGTSDIGSLLAGRCYVVSSTFHEGDGDIIAQIFLNKTNSNNPIATPIVSFPSSGARGDGDLSLVGQLYCTTSQPHNSAKFSSHHAVRDDSTGFGFHGNSNPGDSTGNGVHGDNYGVTDDSTTDPASGAGRQPRGSTKRSFHHIQRGGGDSVGLGIHGDGEPGDSTGFGFHGDGYGVAGEATR